MYGLSGSEITLENQPSRHDCLEDLLWVGKVQNSHGLRSKDRENGGRRMTGS